MNKEIKPCPFCGGMAKIERVPMRRDNAELVFVKCTACHSTGHKFRESPVDDYANDAIDVWNRRV